MTEPSPPATQSAAAGGPARRQALGRGVRRVLVITLALNVFVAVLKGAYGLWSGSLAVASDAVHSLVDAGSNVIGLFVIGKASKPPDQEHPYGHRKLELLAATGIGIAVGATAFRFAWSAIEGLTHGREPPATPLGGFALLGVTLAVNVFVAAYEARRARELGSAFLAADAAHTASDVTVTIAVLASHAAARGGVAWADPLGALLVIAVIGRVAWRILSANLDLLIDRAVLDADEIARIVRAVPGVSDCHRIRSRGTDTAALVDLHVLMDGDLTLRRAHRIAHAVEEALRKEISGIADIVVHMEPDDDEFEGL